MTSSHFHFLRTSPLAYLLLFVAILLIFAPLYGYRRFKGAKHEEAAARASKDLKKIFVVFFVALILSMIVYSVFSSFA